jgi:hypothetical protein
MTVNDHSGIILAAWTKWIATANSPRPLRRTAPGTELADRQNKVIAAGRMESALATNPRTEGPLVNPDQADHYRRRNVDYEAT